MEILKSDTDPSVNFIIPYHGSQIEARYVERPGKMIIYLSSQTGCEQACRFCHLTQLGMNRDVKNVSPEMFVEQARIVVEHIKSILEGKPPEEYPEVIHVNLMARGDPMANYRLLLTYHVIQRDILEMTSPWTKVTKFKVSSIIPNELPSVVPADHVLREVIINAETNSELYYSLYSTRSAFRRKWLARGMDPAATGNLLRGVHSGLVIHHALIKGENDSLEDVSLIGQWLDEHDLRVRVNIVAYNPANDKCGEETDPETMARYIEAMGNHPRVDQVKKIFRVGFDVKASCGMFVGDND